MGARRSSGTTNVRTDLQRRIDWTTNSTPSRRILTQRPRPEFQSHAAGAISAVGIGSLRTSSLTPRRPVSVKIHLAANEVGTAGPLKLIALTVLVSESGQTGHPCCRAVSRNRPNTSPRNLTAILLGCRGWQRLSGLRKPFLCESLRRRGPRVGTAQS